MADVAMEITEEVVVVPEGSRYYFDNDYCSSILQRMKSQRETGKFCDVVLHVDGQLFHAHRSVLAVVSPYFDSVLKKHKAVREQLTFECDSHEIFHTLLDFMYIGQIMINPVNVDELFRLANQLSLDKLKLYCEDFLHNFMTVDTCFKVKELAAKHSAEALMTNVTNFILKSLVDVLRANEILGVDLKSFEEFITDKRFDIGSCILRLISRWINRDKPGRIGFLSQLLQLVKFEEFELEFVWEFFREDELYLSNDKSSLIFLEELEKRKMVPEDLKLTLDELRIVFGSETGVVDIDTKDLIDLAAVEKTEVVKNINEEMSDQSDARPVDDFEDSGGGSNEENIEKSPPEVKVPPLKLTKLLAHRAKTAAKLGRVGRPPKSTPARQNTSTRSSTSRALKASQLKTVPPPKPSLEERKRKAAAVAAALAVEANWSDSDTSIEFQPVSRTRTRKGTPVKRVVRKSSDSGSSKKSIDDIKTPENEDGNDNDGAAQADQPIEILPIASCTAKPKAKRKPGRPMKISVPPYIITVTPSETPTGETRRKRGRPRKCLRMESRDEIPSEIIAFAQNSDGATDVENHLVSDVDLDDGDYNQEGANVSPLQLKRSVGPKKVRRPRGLTRPYEGRGKCPHCSYIEHSAIRLERHVARVHSKEITYKCSLCEYTCNWNREFYIHMKVHFQGPPYTCESCAYTCDRVQLLLKHRMRHTDERPFKCDQCKYTSRTEWNLRIHMRCHTGEKPYQCDLCGRRFSMKAGLDQHVQSHRKDRPFLCDTCGFATKYKSYLVSHMRIHAGTAFRCDYPNCEYFTPKRSQLKAHMRTHKAVRAHICAICGRGFVERSHLVRHERIHLNEKPFKCDHCDYTSSRRDKLKEHIDKHHNTNSESVAKAPYKPRKPRRPKPDPSMFPRIDYPTHGATDVQLVQQAQEQQAAQLQAQVQQQQQQHQVQHQQQAQHDQQQAQTHPSEAILIHAAHQAEFQTPTLIYHQDHLASHHHHDHTSMVAYQSHKHHNPHHHPMEGVQLDQRLVVPSSQMVHHENHQQCPQQHPDLSGLHVGAFMAVY